MGNKLYLCNINNVYRMFHNYQLYLPSVLNLTMTFPLKIQKIGLLTPGYFGTNVAFFLRKNLQIVVFSTSTSYIHWAAQHFFLSVIHLAVYALHFWQNLLNRRFYLGFTTKSDKWNSICYPMNLNVWKMLRDMIPKQNILFMQLMSISGFVKQKTWFW